MGNCYYCCYCKKDLEKEKENEINSLNYNTNVTYSSTNIELCITDGVYNFNWTFSKNKIINKCCTNTCTFIN